MLEESGGNIVDCSRHGSRKLACGFPLEENYFAWQAFGRRYDHDRRRAVPDYLRPASYGRAAGARRAGRDARHVAGVIPADAAGGGVKPVRAAGLAGLDVVRRSVADLWGQIARVAQPGSRVIFRTAGERSRGRGGPAAATCSTRFACEHDLARRLHDRDRSAIYGMFHLYIMN